MKLTKLSVENARNPISIDTKTPHFSWNAVDTENNWRQGAYRIVVTKEDPSVTDHIVWDSGKVISNRMLQIEYQGAELLSDTRYYWYVTVWQEGKEEPVQSETAYFETALYDAEDWKGCFIGEEEDQVYHIFRRTFRLRKGIKRVKLFVCGLGHYVFYLNGSRVSNRVLEPGWTDYNKTYLYSAYDVTDMLKEGRNAAGVMLSDGMYNVPGGRHVYYQRSYGKIKLRVQMNILYEDGSMDCVVTDDDWRMAKSPITFCCIYGGEDYDARIIQKGFSEPEFVEDKSWGRVLRVSPPMGRACCQTIPPLMERETYQPVKITNVEENSYVFDFGYNHSGYIKIKLRCTPQMSGKKVHMIPAEQLSPEGRAIQPLTPAGHYWNYICNEEEEQEFKAEFTYTGYRYVEIRGIVLQEDYAEKVGIEKANTEIESAEKANTEKANTENVTKKFITTKTVVTENDQECVPVLISVESIFIYPDIEENGGFHCSNQLFNDIHRIIKQAILSNTKSYFTDCPHREKLGWIEQTHLIGPSIMYNYGVQNLYRKVSMDMEDAQYENGLVPDVCPGYVGEIFAKWHTGYIDSPEWGCACIINPWYVYQFYGDDSLLKQYYSSMRRYILYLKSKAHHGILRHGLGDWLDIGPNKPFSQNTPMQVIATNIYYYSLGIMKKIAEILGKEKDMSEYAKIMEEVYEEYNEIFFDDQTNRYATGSQAAQAMSLISGLFRKEREQEIVDYLVKDITLRNHAITGGDIGHPFTVAALMKYGRSDILNTMTNITDKPGYGYQVVHGATTLTEEWDGPEPGNPHGSLNHLMLGSIEEWFFGGLAGLYSIRAGLPFGEMLIKPHFPDDIDHLEAFVTHPYGRTSIKWKRCEDGLINITIEIPANLTTHFINEKTNEETIYGSGRYKIQL